VNKTRQKKAETREDLFRLLCDHLSTGVALCDDKGGIVYLNPALKMLFDGEIHHWTDLKSFLIALCEKPFSGDAELGEKLGHIDSFMKKALPGKIIEEVLLVHRGETEGTSLHIRAALLGDRQCLIIFEGDSGDGALACVFDGDWGSEDTARLLRKLVHDSDNILGAVSGYAELALDDLSDQKESLRHFVQQILRGSMRARDLMKKIESLTMLVEGRAMAKDNSHRKQTTAVQRQA
jgi:nitrogen-specific signal transduction histidine kinase